MPQRDGERERERLLLLLLLLISSLQQHFILLKLDTFALYRNEVLILSN